MKILALDPATTTGYAHSDGHVGVWRLHDDENEPVQSLYVKLCQAAMTWEFGILAAENAQQGSHNFNTQGFHRELLGIIRLVARQFGATLVLYNPLTIKKYATGYGKADKQQMVSAAKLQFGLDLTADAADARFVLEMAMRGVPGQKSRRKPYKTRKRVDGSEH